MNTYTHMQILPNTQNLKKNKQKTDLPPTPKLLKMTLNSRSSFLYLPQAKITGTNHPTWIKLLFTATLLLPLTNREPWGFGVVLFCGNRGIFDALWERMSRSKGTERQTKWHTTFLPSAQITGASHHFPQDTLLTPYTLFRVVRSTSP